MTLNDLRRIRMRVDMLTTDDLRATLREKINHNGLLLGEFSIRGGHWPPQNLYLPAVMFERTTDDVVLGSRRQRHLASYCKYLVPELQQVALGTLSFKETTGSYVLLPSSLKTRTTADLKVEWCWDAGPKPWHAPMTPREWRWALRLVWFLSQVRLGDLDDLPPAVARVPAPRRHQTFQGVWGYWP